MDETAIEGFFARNFVPDGTGFADGERFSDVLTVTGGGKRIVQSLPFSCRE